MSGTDTISIGKPLPRLASVSVVDDEPFRLAVTWKKGARAGHNDVVDVAPQIFTFKVYRPLRDDPALFARAKISDDRTAVVWPGDADLEIAAHVLEDLAQQTMTSADFAAFIKAQGWTFDAAAAQLGIARRLVAYYAKDRAVPRTVALACKGLRDVGVMTNGPTRTSIDGITGRVVSQLRLVHPVDDTPIASEVPDVAV